MLDRRRSHLVVAAVVVVVDQLTKAWALEALDGGRTIDLVGTLRLRLAFNTGASFSLGTGRGAVIGLLVAGIAVAMVVHGPRVPGRAGQLAVGLVLGGAVGNLLDRALRAGDGFLGGAVVDFVDLQWWPVFNVADAGVVVGALLLVWASREPSEAERAEADGA